jgi:hypothetical protein
MAAQAEFAKRLLRDDEEREEVIKRDIEAATTAQAQWEADAIELEQQVRRAVEDAERREEEERRREAEEMERRARDEAARKAEEERRMRVAECVSCMEEGERKEMCELGCGHGYCGSCVVGEPPFPLIFSLMLPLYDQEQSSDIPAYRGSQVRNEIPHSFQMLQHHHPRHFPLSLHSCPPHANLFLPPPRALDPKPKILF